MVAKQASTGKRSRQAHLSLGVIASPVTPPLCPARMLTHRELESGGNSGAGEVLVEAERRVLELTQRGRALVMFHTLRYVSSLPLTAQVSLCAIARHVTALACPTNRTDCSLMNDTNAHIHTHIESEQSISIVEYTNNGNLLSPQ